jgi:hypothetical protein
MGGQSSSGLAPAADGSGAVWTGDLIVEGGGFCGARTFATTFDLGAYDGISLRVKGDGQTFKLNIKTVSAGAGQGWVAGCTWAMAMQGAAAGNSREPGIICSSLPACPCSPSLPAPCRLAPPLLPPSLLPLQDAQTEKPEDTYQATFDTLPEGDWTTVFIPWHEFVLVKRARSVPGAPPIDPSRIRQFGLVLSRCGSVAVCGMP